MRIKAILCASSQALPRLLACCRRRRPRPEIRLAQQFSMGYLQLNVMEHQQLIEKHAKALGIPEVKVSWLTFNGPAAVNDALLSGNIDIASGRRARPAGAVGEDQGHAAGGARHFGAELAAVPAQQPRPGHQDHQGFQASDHIAVPAVKVSVQAITLQMAAAKAYGIKEFAKLDTLTVSMSPPDATIALLGGKSRSDLGVQRAAVPVSATRKPGRPHRAQFLRRHGRISYFHGGLDHGEIP